VGCIVVADIVSCDHGKVMRLYVGATCGYCQFVIFPYYGLVIGGGGFTKKGGRVVCVRSASICGPRWRRA
jgi:hypothetical protein